MRLPSSVQIGWRSVKANAVPMVVLWTMAGALVVGYYCLPGMRAVLDVLGRFQKSYGVWAGFASQFVFCGAIPCLFLSDLASKSRTWTAWNARRGIISGMAVT